MTEEKKLPLAQLETDPQGFMERMGQDRVWMNRIKKESEMRVQMGFLPAPQECDFPNYEAWNKARAADRHNFMEASGIRERQKQVTALYWCGEFDAGQLFWVKERNAGKDPSYRPGISTDLLDISDELNFIFGECTLENVVAEYRRRMAH